MSEFLAAAVAALGTPEEMVVRSATARAAAQGVTVDEILAFWGGGAPAPTTAHAPATAPETVAEAATAAPEMPATEADPIEEPIAVTAAPVAVLVESEPEIIIVPAPLRDRIIVSGKLGAMLGAMFGVVLAVAAAPYAMDQVRLVGDADDVRTIIGVTGGSLTLWLAVVSAVIGGLIGRLAGIVPAWIDEGLSVRTSPNALTMVGAATGAVLGVVGSGVLLAIGETIESFEESVPSIVQIGVLDVFVTLIMGGAILGAITAVLAQLSSLPEGLTDAEKDESELIKHRLVTSYLMPAIIMVGIAAVVVIFGQLLVIFHNIAWILAMAAASGILAFASLSATRPTMRITKGEFLVALAAIATVLLFIVLLASTGSTEPAHEEAIRHLHAL